ncbi:AMP-binding protein [Thiomicrorhabdus arctica]|uniref:AMP-binding protein n=1 Tax=Thiomicrorhabdus arctica TaxID=131540 RepID=UPI0003656EA2|nr:AMP-binding protein [Thiomicrorhabdus arctica]
MLSFLLNSQSPTELQRLWQSTPFIYREAPDQSLTRWEVFLAAEQLSQTALSIHSNMKYSALLLFEQRDYFLVGLLATAMQKGQVILPPNLAEATLEKLKNDMPELSVLGDDLPKGLHSQPQITSKLIDEIFHAVKKNPLPFDQQRMTVTFEAIKKSEIWLYTSGSTGKPKKIIKTWQHMIYSASLAIDRFQLMLPCYIVATVPNQHMFGLETTLFWPFFSKASLWYERPIFAEDVISALSNNSIEPAFLVSTPLHLTKLLAFKLKWPAHLNRLLSATAPLSKTLAEQLESEFKASLFEVYGSTETASIASRQTTVTEVWQTYTSVTFERLTNERYAVKTSCLEDSQVLSDQIELLDEHHFKLGKRDSDLIKVAGKRASLTELNTHLLSISGITEGVFIQDPSTERLRLFVTTSLTPSDILRELRKLLDPAFLPRPITYVKALPRSEVGKILYNKLLCKRPS